ncbi:hypothetical protein C8Q79DRAFT_984983 [Trametes meyenii]|nr:hypothetical protein C8Q79DRAFT_984983 [Trametes meyenii]
MPSFPSTAYTTRIVIPVEIAPTLSCPQLAQHHQRHHGHILYAATSMPTPSFSPSPNPHNPHTAHTIEQPLYSPHLAARTLNTHACASPSSTPDSSQASTTAPGVNPVVPALIAVVVFVVCTFVVLKAFRAMRPSGVTPVYHPLVEEEKPHLWEVSVPQNRFLPTCGLWEWCQLMPVSVEYLPTTCPTTSSPRRPLSIGVFSQLDNFRSFSRDSRRSSSWSVPPKKSAASDRSGVEERMRVAVLIAMPSPDRTSNLSSVTLSMSTPPTYLGLTEIRS